MNTDTPTFQMASLYVGDLHPDITESNLFEKFSAAGAILSIRICRDVNTRRSLGYAYVNFQMPADAERLLDTMNFETIRDRPIRMMWSNRDPTVRRSGIGNIFLKDLQKEIDTKALFDTFSAFGNIISCKVALDDKGKSKGFGFIHFETEEASNTAIEKVNGKLLNGKKVYVGKFIPRHERVKELGEQKPVFTNVYVKNLVEDIDDEKLTTMFEPFGNITSCKVMCMDDGKSRGFGFVGFTTTEAAQAAVEALNGQKVNETKNLFVSRAQCKLEREQELKRKFDDFKKQRNEAVQGVNLYVKNLDDTFDDERLRKEFSAYGTITSAIVMTDEQRRSRGFGFVCFSAPNEATRAVTELNGHVIGSKRLFVSLAQRKEDRHALLAAQYSAQQVNGAIRMQPQLGQLYQPNGAASFFVPTMPTVPRFYGGPRIPAPARNAPRWVPQVRPNAGNQGPAQPGVSFQNANMVAARIQQQPAYNVPPNVMPSGRARTINGQQASGSANNMQRPGGSGSATAHNIPQYSPGFDFTATVRNPPVQQHVQAPPQQLPVQLPQQLPVQQKIQENPFATRLLNAKPQEQKQILGERLYPLIERMHGNLAGKITGMLLEIENSELLHMLEDSIALNAKVEEAVAVLQVKHYKPAN